MNKGLIYPDECYAIRRAIYEVYDEIGSGLLIKEIQRNRRELFESLELYYKVITGRADPEEIMK